MTCLRFAVLAVLLLPVACSTGPDPLLPPLAQVEVPVIERRALPDARPGPVQLVGETQQGVTNAMGVPDLKRREDPAEIWRYGDDRCSVHLFFYDMNGEMAVRHVDTRVNGDSGLSEDQCLASLYRRGSAR